MRDDVRVHYCKLWQSVIAADIEEIKKHSESLGVGDYYGLFACMVAGRSWDAIQGGINKTTQDAREVCFIGFVVFLPNFSFISKFCHLNLTLYYFERTLKRRTKLYLSVMKQKGESQNGGNKTKHVKFSKKNSNISYLLIRTRTFSAGKSRYCCYLWNKIMYV